jgi:hypothetical protein
LLLKHRIEKEHSELLLEWVGVIGME